MRSRQFDVVTNGRQPNGIQHTIVSELVGKDLLQFARIVDRSTVDGRVVISLERASGQHPKGTLKDIWGKPLYTATAPDAVEMLDTLREVGAL